MKLFFTNLFGVTGIQYIMEKSKCESFKFDMPLLLWYVSNNLYLHYPTKFLIMTEKTRSSIHQWWNRLLKLVGDKRIFFYIDSYKIKYSKTCDYFVKFPSNANWKWWIPWEKLKVKIQFMKWSTILVLAPHTNMFLFESHEKQTSMKIQQQDS